MLQYCAKAKFSIEEIMQKHDLLSSPVTEILNEMVQLCAFSACIPKEGIKKAVALIKDQRLKRKYKEEIAAIEGFSSTEIYERLPHYLGLCIKNTAENGHYQVIYFDSYESLVARTDTVFFEAYDEWLKELFISSEIIRMVICSRDRLQWDLQDPDWDEYLNQHRLENLTEDDCHWFLNNVPITDEKVVKSIVTNALSFLDQLTDLSDLQLISKEYRTDSVSGQIIYADHIYRNTDGIEIRLNNSWRYKDKTKTTRISCSRGTVTVIHSEQKVYINDRIVFDRPSEDRLAGHYINTFNADLSAQKKDNVKALYKYLFG